MAYSARIIRHILGQCGYEILLLPRKNAKLNISMITGQTPSAAEDHMI